MFVDASESKGRGFGWEYRLPTEEERVYAARGGPLSDPAASGFDFYFDQPTNQLLQTQANFAGTDLKLTDAIGKHAPNPLGLHDLFGNVNEWCSKGEQHPGDKTWRRVVRGGSWQHPPTICHTAQRDSYVPVIRLDHLGLRVARVRAAL